MNAVEATNITKIFGRVAALRDVDFSLPAGSVGGLVGPNGAGKTTLFSIIAGFLKPSRGKVSLFGEPLKWSGPMCGQIAILPQDARFLRGISIRRQFQWYASLMGMDRQQARSETERVLEEVGLAKAGSKEGDQLSHGMRKRMAIAQALIGSPKFMLLDEPTAGLDPANARRLRDLIAGCRGEHTVLVSSHNLEEIAEVCDHVVVLDKGRVVESKSISELTQHQGLITFRLADPAPDEAVAALEQLSVVLRVDVPKDRRSLTCLLASETAEDPKIVAELVSALAKKGIGFIEMHKGTTLEERFLDITGRESS